MHGFTELSGGPQQNVSPNDLEGAPGVPQPKIGRWVSTRFCLLVCGVVVLVGLQLRWLHGLGELTDLHVWDELVYRWMVGDWILSDGHIDWAWCPLYSLAYFFLDLIPWQQHVPDLMFTGLSVLLPLVLWWACAPFTGHWLGWMFAAWFGASPVLVPYHAIGAPLPSGVYAFTAGMAYFGFGLVARGRLWSGLLAMVLAGVTRAEYSPWIACLGLFVAASLRRRAPFSRRMFYLCIALIPLCLGAMHPDFKARSWLAFRQHYGQKAQLESFALEWESRGGIVPPGRFEEAVNELQQSFDVPDKWIARDFGHSASVAEAMMENPARFRWHVADVVWKTPSSLGNAVSCWFAPKTSTSLGVLALLTAALLGWCGRMIKRLPEVGLPRLEAAAMIACSPLALAASLLVGARSELALPVIPALVTVVALGLRCLIAMIVQVPGRYDLAVVRAAAVVLGCMLILFAVGPFHGSRPPLPFRDGVDLMNEKLPPGARRIMTTNWSLIMRLCARSDLVPLFPALSEGQSFQQFLEQHRVDAIHVNPKLIFELRHVPDALHVMQSGGWVLEGQQGAAMLFVREELCVRR